MDYHIGDQLICRVNKDGTVIFDIDWNDKRYQEFDTQLFEIIGIFKHFYIILAPWPITNSSLIDADVVENWEKLHHEKVQIDPKYFGKRIYLIQERSVGGRATFDPYADPLQCKVCLEYVPWAEPNQADGSLVCWVCRSTRIFE